MQIARNVQRALLPEQMPQVVRATSSSRRTKRPRRSAAITTTASDSTTDKICLAFGDVAGKGVPASLVMSRLSSVVQNTMEFVHDVDKAIVAINNHMCNNAVEGRFVTFVLVVLDTSTHELALVNAGHMSPMIRTRRRHGRRVPGRDRSACRSA